MTRLGKKLAASICTLSMFAALASATPAALAETIDDVTVLVYMNGSDLESADLAGAATSDLEEMMTVGSTDNVNIVVETGGTLEWAYQGISGEENQRWLVEADGLVLVEDGLGARNIGEPETLSDFIEWGVANYPAEQYALVFWNHGSGSVHGFGADELFEHDSLSLPEIQTALEAAYEETGALFEVVGFDACLMATVETASMLAPYANVLVASEELEPGHGWDYAPIMRYIASQDDIDGEALGKIIADGYKAQAIAQDTEEDITLSVVDLSRIEAVETALDLFIRAASRDIDEPQRLKAVTRARSKAEDYGNGGGTGSDTDMVDLADLAKQAADLYPSEANRLVRSIEDAVVYNINSVRKPNASGLSIYFPYKDKDNFESNLDIYAENPFSPTYLQFLENYVGALNGDTDPVRFEESAPQALEPASEEDEYEALYQVSIDENDMADIAEAYSVLATYADGSDSVVMFLGMDDTVTIDEETGTLEDAFWGTWVTLNGHFVSMFLNGYAEDFTEYAIPALLNGEEVDILVNFNYDTGESKIVGAWRGIDEESNMADKNIIKIKKGDRIAPLFYAYDEATDEEDFYLEGETFTVTGELELGETDLPEGRYLYGFYLIDYAQNESYSDFVELELVDEVQGEGSEAEESYEESADPEAIYVEIDGELQDYDQPPVIINGYTMLPLRAIFTALGAEIDWDAATSTVSAKKGDTEVVLQIGNKNAKIDGGSVTLQQSAQLVNGNTMVPVRFVSEALGAEVAWDADTRTVAIVSP
ncbi:clostripain-related cysteine peptidase [Paenibacillus sp. TRM 82003]|nr:clostripain-related cysteine peptidase [Paenibacillus sp. TRM 82003]